MKYLTGAIAALIMVALMAAVGDVTYIKENDTKVIPCGQASQVATIAINNAAWDGTAAEMLSVVTWVERGATNVCKMRVRGKDTLAPPAFNAAFPSGAQVLEIEQ